MKKQLKPLLVVCCVCLPFHRPVTLPEKRNTDYRKIANSTKLELVYKSGPVTEYSTQRGFVDDHLAQQLDVSQTPLSKMGARIGYQALGMFGSSPIGSKIAIELGVRPGPKGEKFPGDNFYLHMVLGFVLGGRLGN